MIKEIFANELKALEAERLRSVRDWRGYSLALVLSGGLFVLCFLAFISVTSIAFLILSFLFMSLSAGIALQRNRIGLYYFVKFRDAIVRPWFRTMTPAAYLVQSRPGDETARDFMMKFPNHLNYRVNERILFDLDPYGTELYLLTGRPTLFGGLQQLCVWRQPRANESAVSFRLSDVTSGVSRALTAPKLEVRSSVQPTRDQTGAAQRALEALAQLASELNGSRTMVLDFTPEGVSLSLGLKESLFEAPFDESVLEEDSFSKWKKQADVIMSVRIRSALNELRSST